MISNEDLDLVKKAQQVITKLDGGASIVGGSQEHLDLTRAVVKLSGLVLTRPMTNQELEDAKAHVQELKESGML
jgi:hypothetical protein